jgi:hypothetical protein
MFIIILHNWFSEPDKQEVFILIILQCYVILCLYSWVYIVWSVLDLLICVVVVVFFFLSVSVDGDVWGLLEILHFVLEIILAVLSFRSKKNCAVLLK